ncbi:unnamed protein product [Strongylus vulgaris]|uniref:SprT-like domain-containing protein n=1 Tax=Strongylus vulgaris TaxID=40348 RepID=A0A3P7JR03_STRVU|nr:unnamed protein product [Strongylus vulgaris]
MSYDLVDPALELSDPCPDIHLLFIDFNDRFFEGTLARCEVKWSPRMYSCAGVCSYEGRSGMCSIRLSLPLLKLRPRKDLVETLLVARNDPCVPFCHQAESRQRWPWTRLSVSYVQLFPLPSTFTFIAPVYRCDGPCRNRKPFYGYVKRSSNRAPGPNDLWWSAHKSSCNGKPFAFSNLLEIFTYLGTFQKIQEPEGYGQKKRKATNNENAVPEKKISPNNSLDKYFTGKGHVLGTLSSSQSALTVKNSKLLDLYSSNTANNLSSNGKLHKIFPSIFC